MNHYIQIKGNESWNSLKNVDIQEKVVDVCHCTAGLSRSDSSFDHCQFIHVEDIFFRHCDQNMIWFHLKPEFMLKVNNIYLDNSFEPDIYDRFADHVRFYITYNAITNFYWYFKSKDENNNEYIMVRGKKIYLLSEQDMENKLLELI